MKNILVFIGIVGIGVGIWYGGMYLTRSTTTHILPGTVVSAGQMKHVEEAQYYSISITHPEKTPLQNRLANQRALNTMEQWLVDDIEKFKEITNVDQLPPEDRQMLESIKRKYEYEATYKMFTASNKKLISYEFDMYVDTGGAHPTGYFKTFVFDAEGNEITPPDLFESGSNYLERLSEIVLADVKAELTKRVGRGASDSIFAEGLAPKEENFSNFVVDDNTLIILIPPYQAAAYAAGTFEVHIPLAQLSDILREEWK